MTTSTRRLTCLSGRRTRLRMSSASRSQLYPLAASNASRMSPSPRDEEESLDSPISLTAPRYRLEVLTEQTF